uniref:Uncharacterized protein n=1 Tax=viral metagenome TaxID=1070528 RepID=A0A6C0DIL9_9ZZZZ
MSYASALERFFGSSFGSSGTGENHSFISSLTSGSSVDRSVLENTSNIIASSLLVISALVAIATFIITMVDIWIYTMQNIITPRKQYFLAVFILSIISLVFSVVLFFISLYSMFGTEIPGFDDKIILLSVGCMIIFALIVYINYCIWEGNSIFSWNSGSQGSGSG